MHTNDFIDKKIIYYTSKDAHFQIHSFVLFNFSKPSISSIPTYLYSYSQYSLYSLIPRLSPLLNLLSSDSRHDPTIGFAFYHALIEMGVETLCSHLFRSLPSSSPSSPLEKVKTRERGIVVSRKGERGGFRILLSLFELSI